MGLGPATPEAVAVAPARPSLAELAGRARPVALAGERVLPVLAPLVPLLPEGGLRRGTVISTTAAAGGAGSRRAGSTSLALALLAGPSAAGSWCAAVGLSSLGLMAVAQMGVALDRFPLVASPAGTEEWAWAVAALLDAVDVVMARPPGPVGEARARRLAARARERSAVLVVPGGEAWPGGADVRLEVVRSAWEGVGDGHGCLRARRVDVVAQGRGAAARARRVALWLPGPRGGVESAGETSVAVAPAPDAGIPPAEAVG